MEPVLNVLRLEEAKADIFSHCKNKELGVQAKSALLKWSVVIVYDSIAITLLRVKYCY